jgi:heterodisulfide reductase subunit A-like polyferredoxin
MPLYLHHYQSSSSQLQELVLLLLPLLLLLSVVSSIMTSSGLKRNVPNGISVLISGAGVGGLMTALECWRKGCDVRIFERTKSNITAGQYLNVATLFSAYASQVTRSRLVQQPSHPSVTSPTCFTRTKRSHTSR